MTLTPTRDPWALDKQPRDHASGRFEAKAQSAPEPGLITSVPWHLREDLTPISDADNPLLVEALSAQTEHGDSSERWAEAINAYFDGDEQPRNDDDVFTIVQQTIGTPRDQWDVAHWTARTAAWRDHALAVLAADQS